MSLPQEVQPKVMSQLPPNTRVTNVVCTPNNASVFNQSEQIVIDLPNNGFMNPNSLYIRYRTSCTGHTAGAKFVAPIPLYAFCVNFQLLINNNVVENINDWNIYANDMVNLKLDPSNKVGLSQALGIGGVGTQFTLQQVNGRTLTATPDIFSMSGPLPCLLSQCENYVPLHLFGAIRMVFTLDTIANLFDAATTPPTGWQINSFEICFDSVNFGYEVESYYNSLANQQGKIVLKSSSASVSTNPLASGSGGGINLPYSIRLASIKSLITHFSPAMATSATSNGKWDSLDPSSSNGTFQYDIQGGTLLPARELSTALNKNAFISELALALYGNRSILNAQFGITPAGWNTTSSAYGAGGSRTFNEPSTWYFAQNSERCPSSNSLLTGMSSLTSPVVLKMNLNTNTSQALTCRLIALFDALLEIDINTREVKILQ